jgi:ribonuclease BN (tRNA processing enzyme)
LLKKPLDHTIQPMPIRVALLPAGGDPDRQLQPLTSFLLNDALAIDAGSLGFALPPPRLDLVRDIVLTHAHLDHIVSLPIALVEMHSRLQRPLRIHGLAATLDAVRAHLLNDAVWVDFTRLKLPGSQENCIQMIPIRPDESFTIDGLTLRGVSMEHPVPTLGMLVESPTVSIAFTSDTSRLDTLVPAASRLKNLRAVFADCSFPSGMEDLARQSGHMTPSMILQQSAGLPPGAMIYCVHLKPSHRQAIVRELAPLRDRIRVMEIGREYVFE